MTTTISALPRIVQVLHTTDAGEFGADNCAHCGADCRYQTVFLAAEADGSLVKRAAARGCIQLFPRSPIADVHVKASKTADEKRRKGWKLASWDQARLDACEAFYAGQITEAEALDRCKRADYDARQYAAKKFGGRR